MTLAVDERMVDRSPLVSRIIECALAVHNELGPGLLESSYDSCLAYEFMERGVPFRRQVAMPVVYRGVQIECGYRLDFVVDKTVLVELKSVEKLLPVHAAQVRTYLKLSGLSQALLLNFNCRLLKEGLASFRRSNSLAIQLHQRPPDSAAETTYHAPQSAVGEPSDK